MNMSEKIKDFLEQAHTYSFQENRGQFVLNDFSEKFAELIVRECASIADIEKSNLIGCGYITKTKGMLIKEHFGVEE